MIYIIYISISTQKQVIRGGSSRLVHTNKGAPIQDHALMNVRHDKKYTRQMEIFCPTMTA